MWLVILLYALCASMFTISKFVLGYSQPIFFMAMRMIGAGVLLGGYYIFRAKKAIAQYAQSTLSDWFLFVQIILFHVYITYICDLCALQQLTSIESSFIYNLSPFLSALFSYIWFAERMTSKKWMGLLLGFSSLLPDLITEPVRFSHKLYPLIITFIAVVSSAYGWVIVRKLVKDRGYSPIYVNSIGMFCGGLAALITSYITESWVSSPVSNWSFFIQGTLLIIVVSNLLFYNLYGFLLTFYTATFLSLAGFLCPFFTALFGYFILHEPIPHYFIISNILVCIGLLVFYQEEIKQGYINQ
jgi:drug/metabolite transporter (DMT)-like permease